MRKYEFRGQKIGSKEWVFGVSHSFGDRVFIAAHEVTFVFGNKGI